MRFLKKLFIGLFAVILLLLLACFLYLHFPSRQSAIPFDYEGWDNGSVRHILPQFDHRQLLIKVSFDEIMADAPVLMVNDRAALIRSENYNWKYTAFYINNLNPDTDYTLQIRDNSGNPITDSWQIRTYPHPDSTATDLRILKYTCAGGISESVFGQEVFLDMKYRRALLKRALEENPRIVIANGDHVYWDQKTSDKSFLQKLLKYRRDRMYGKLDLSKSMSDAENHDIFTSIIDDQIIELYGCLLREQSVYFMTDDHDLLENDDAIKEKDIVSFPPEPYMVDAENYTQRLYYPGFLGQNPIEDKVIGFADNGLLRFGNLLGMNLFDAKQFVTLEGEESILVLKGVEKQIVDMSIDSTYVWHFAATSSPFGWTAGKWLEWYPDILDGDNLTIDKEKYLWQEGWWNQHQRLLTAFHQRKNPSIILQGDLHMASFGMIQKSGDLDFSSNPIPVITTAPLGSGKMGFPSSFRGVGATVAIDMQVDEIYAPVERNGFTILNINRTQVNFDIYTWRLPETIDDIKSMRPTFSDTIIFKY